MVQWTRILLWAMSIECYRPQSYVADNGHRWTDVTIHCGWQWSAMDTLDNLWESLAIYVDKFPPPSVVTGNIYQYFVPSSIVAGSINRYISPRLLTLAIYIDRFSPNLLSLAIHINGFYSRLLSLATSIDRCSSCLLSLEISIERCFPRLLSLAIDHCCVYCPGCARFVRG